MSEPTSEWSWPRFWRNAAVIALAVGGCVWFTVEGALPNLSPKNFHVVEEGALYRSGVLTIAALEDVVEDHDIRTIVDFGGHHRPDPGTRREQLAAEVMGVDYVRLPLFGDGRGDPNMYVRALEIMNDPARHPVLVHCAAGSERTGGAVALFQHIFRDVPLDEAYQGCMVFGHSPDRNPRLRPMLETWEDDIERALETGETLPYDGPPAP